MKARLEALEAAKEKQEEELKGLKLDNERRQAEYEAWKSDKEKLKRWVNNWNQPLVTPHFPVMLRACIVAAVFAAFFFSCPICNEKGPTKVTRNCGRILVFSLYV